MKEAPVPEETDPIIARIEQIEAAHKEINTKLDALLTILSGANGVLSILKAVGWAAGIGATVMLAWNSFTKTH